MHLLPGNAQALGQRTEQQDVLAFSDLADDHFVAHSGALCVVCDGMGGHQSGAEAARCAASAFLDRYRSRDPAQPITHSLQLALSAANTAVLELAAGAARPGSTLVAAVLHGACLRWVSVGDSRIWLLRGGRLHRINHEHHHRGDLLRQAAAGDIGWTEAWDDPDGERLVASLGEDPLAAVDHARRPIELLPGDQVYLASDGLYRTLGEATLEQLAEPQADPQTRCTTWLQAAVAAAAPSQDNLTVAGLGWPAPTPPRSVRRGPRLLATVGAGIGIGAAGLAWLPATPPVSPAAASRPGALAPPPASSAPADVPPRSRR